MGVQHCFRSDLLPSLMTRRVQQRTITGANSGRNLWMAHNPSGAAHPNEASVGVSALVDEYFGFALLADRTDWTIGDWVDMIVPVKGSVVTAFCATSCSAGDGLRILNGGLVWTGGSGTVNAIALDDVVSNGNVNIMLTGE